VKAPHLQSLTLLRCSPSPHLDSRPLTSNHSQALHPTSLLSRYTGFWDAHGIPARYVFSFPEFYIWLLAQRRPSNASFAKLSNVSTLSDYDNDDSHGLAHSTTVWLDACSALGGCALVIAMLLVGGCWLLYVTRLARMSIELAVTRTLSVDASAGALGIVLSDRRRGRTGVVVVEVAPGGACAASGIRIGDVIYRINGATVSDRKQAMRQVDAAGTALSTIEFILSGGAPAQKLVIVKPKRAGLTVSDRGLWRPLGLTVTEVASDGAAAAAGLPVGCTILSINDVPVDSLRGAATLLEADEPMLKLVFTPGICHSYSSWLRQWLAVPQPVVHSSAVMCCGVRLDGCKRIVAWACIGASLVQLIAAAVTLLLTAPALESPNGWCGLGCASYDPWHCYCSDAFTATVNLCVTGCMASVLLIACSRAGCRARRRVAPTNEMRAWSTSCLHSSLRVGAGLLGTALYYVAGRTSIATTEQFLELRFGLSLLRWGVDRASTGQAAMSEEEKERITQLGEALLMVMVAWYMVLGPWLSLLAGLVLCAPARRQPMPASDRSVADVPAPALPPVTASDATKHVDAVIPLPQVEPELQVTDVD